MNKIVNINLGGFPFTVDDSAYAMLSNYLDTLKGHFSSSQGYEEIMFDIEARMAELLQENSPSNSIVSEKNLKDAISIMGTPEDFGAIASDYSDQPMDRSANKQNEGKRVGRRLFRDPDDKVVGGVCSGLATYFGWSDPLWIRIAAILLIFTAGFSIIAYLVLMVIVPQASTSADKLAMKGEPINVDTIAKTVKDEFEGIVERGTETLGSIGSKKKSIKNPLFRFDQPYPKGFLF